jgi:hypothetical protein
MPEKRKHRRFIRRCGTEFTSGEVTRTGISSDFSLGGLFIRTNYPLPPDTLIDIIIFLPDGGKSKLKGKVRRSAKTQLGKVLGTPVKSLKNGMGVEILERDANYLHLISGLVR